MTHVDWLQTLAEIGLGFAGFSALIAGMRRGGSTADPANSSRGRAVVETSLSVLFGCTLPVLLHGLGFSETVAFRLAGGLFLIAGAPLTVRGFRRALAIRTQFQPPRPVLSALSGVAGVGGLGFSLAAVVGIPAAAVPTYYLASLISILGIAAVNFAGFVFAIDAGNEPDEAATVATAENRT